MGKYNNHKMFSVIEKYDRGAAQFIERLSRAICIADDIIDRKVHTISVLELMINFVEAMNMVVDRPELYYPIRETLKEVAQSEVENLRFIPGKMSNKEELDILMKRSKLIELYFDVLCFVDSSFRTARNEKWLKEFCRYCLIMNDCADIISGTYEDFVQGRRNYVALTKFSQNIYFEWREKKKELGEAAMAMVKETHYPEPVDKRLNMVKGGSNA